jgi:hypothetical protein
MSLDTTDAGVPPFIMGVTNVLTAYLPVKWSRFFPAIPIVLGLIYGFIVRPAPSPDEGVVRASAGAGAIALYSVIRNLFGTKPKDAK